jgi:hypothetical protein
MLTHYGFSDHGLDLCMEIRLEESLAVYDGLASLIWELMGRGSHLLPATYDYSNNLMYISSFSIVHLTLYECARESE